MALPASDRRGQAMSRHYEIPHVVEIVSPERFPLMSAVAGDRDADKRPPAEPKPGEEVRPAVPVAG
jgi:hypothetical protein